PAGSRTLAGRGSRAGASVARAVRMVGRAGAGWLPGRKPDCDRRSHSRGAGDGDGAVDALHTIGEADEPGPVPGVGAARAVVADLELQRSVADGGAYARAGGPGVLDGVGQRLDYHEV